MGNTKPYTRDVRAMLASKRCEAKTRSGTSCKSPAVKGKVRCRMHGGAKGSGGQVGNRNAFKHGLSTREMINHRKMINQMLRDGRNLLG